MTAYKITSKIDFQTIQKIISEKQPLALSDESKKKIIKCREYLDKKIKSSKESIYGINTGFGALCNKTIPEK
ncbi:MAG: aromatic amino acid lyase, partial [Bacteroidota bacterium]